MACRFSCGVVHGLRRKLRVLCASSSVNFVCSVD
jgi:hypothetical protein